MIEISRNRSALCECIELLVQSLIVSVNALQSLAAIEVLRNAFSLLAEGFQGVKVCADALEK